MSLRTTLLLVGALIAYALLQPRLEQWLGVELPSLKDNDVVQSDVPPSSQDDPPHSAVLDTPTVVPADSSADSAPGDATSSSPSSEAALASTTKSNLGELVDIGGNTFRSSAGLYYRPGSQEGHRIKHILRHHQDDPDRPVHGVFDGDRNEVFAVIDEAYVYTFDHGPPRVTRETDDGRTIFVVDLGRRIGYVGGEKGQRTDHPAAHHVQLILDGTNVITAYPVRVGRGRG